MIYFLTSALAREAASMPPPVFEEYECRTELSEESLCNDPWEGCDVVAKNCPESIKDEVCMAVSPTFAISLFCASEPSPPPPAYPPVTPRFILPSPPKHTRSHHRQNAGCRI